MNIPYVIDNEKHKLSDVLNALLVQYQGRCLDVATAYFTVGGFGLLKDGLGSIGNCRLLLGAEPRSGEQIGLKPDPRALLASIRSDLEREPFSEETLRLVEDLIRFLRQNNMAVRVHDRGFLHAKCFLFYSDQPGKKTLFDRLNPVLSIVGSSNFTVPGLTSNRELNFVHKVLLDEKEAVDEEAERAVRWLCEDKPNERISLKNRQLLKSEVGARAIVDLGRWFDRQWKDARDFKDELIEILNASKFGENEYTPYQVYMKALYEYFKDDLEGAPQQIGRTAVDLTQFQEHAVTKARKILAQYNGVMICDSVGLGKTWIGKRLLEDYAYHLRQRALVICPASLRNMWTDELADATISATILSQEEVGQVDFPVEDYGKADVVLIDESHNFRNKTAQRYQNLDRLLGHNGGRGESGERKKIILLTATPINNDLMDLYHQINLVTGGDRSYFSAAGIGDLQKYFHAARRQSHAGESTVALFNLLEEICVRRTRPFIKKAYPDATIRGERIRFPDRRLHTTNYDLEKTYQGIYQQVVTGVESLNLAPYNLESYKKAGVEIDEFEQGREEALVGIFKSRLLKRFESSVAAFKISVRRALAFQKTFESYILDGKVLKSADFQKAMRYLEREDEEDEATPTSKADELDENEEAKKVLEGMPEINPADYDLRELHDAVQHDIDALADIWHRVKDIGPENDAKLEKLKELLSGQLQGNKLLIFCYYRDTARYLYRELGMEKGEAFRKTIGDPLIRCMDGGYDAKERRSIVERFAPKSNNKPEIAGTDKEIDILISTDVLSEGQNLQDCAHLINYDLHWNPTRMVQRAGRIDRIGAQFGLLHIYNMFPDEGLEELLGLVERLSRKIHDIDQTGMLDASVLGETVHPRNFNTLRRIRGEDGTVIDEEEAFAELASNEFLIQQVRDLLAAGGKEMLDSLPDGIHSGLAKENARGVFFYFKAPSSSGEGDQHFWKYYDLNTDRIADNRYLIARLIQCDRETPRVVGDYDIFALQDKVIENILQSHRQQQALEVTPRSVDPLQQTVATMLQGHLNNPEIPRDRVIAAIRYLNEPMRASVIRELRTLHKELSASSDVAAFVSAILDMRDKYAVQSEQQERKDTKPLRREDLRLICFDHLCS